MAKKGVYKISGPSQPKINEKTTYKVIEWYKDTPFDQRDFSKVNWELFRQRKDGTFTSTNIKKKGTGIFTFTNNAYENVYKIEGYLHSPEGKEPMSIIVKPQKAEVPKQEVPKTKEVLGVTLSYQDGSKISKALSYMDQLRAVAKFKNMAGEKVTFSLWEDDTKGAGHNKENILIAFSGPVQIDSKGNARWDFTLLNTFALFAMAREDDNKQHEYYVLVEYNGNSKASGNVNVNVEGNLLIPKIVINKQKVETKTEAKPKPETAKTSTNENSKNNKTDTKGLIHSVRFEDKHGSRFRDYPKFGETIYLIIEGENLKNKRFRLKLYGQKSLITACVYDEDFIFSDNNTQKIPIELSKNLQNTIESKINPNPFNFNNNSLFELNNQREIIAEVDFETLTSKSQIINVNINEEYKKNNDQSPALVEVEKIENLLDVYFAKKEFTKETGIVDGEYTYAFGGKKSGNKTVTIEEKKKVAEVIIKNIKEKLKNEKKYTTLETISEALIANEYGKDTTNEKTIRFTTYKLGEDYKKIDSIPLGEKLYLVAKTMLLDGKEVTISIKEKDGIIKGYADAILPVMEITEEQMAQTTGEINGTEKTEFKGIVKNNLVKIPIQLRSKSDEDFKQWTEKLSKGKEDGTYTYKFGGTNKIANENNKKEIAKVILKNINVGNTNNSKIEAEKSANIEDIMKVLELKTYEKDNTVTFKVYKKTAELLYLHAKVQGDKLHEKDFLKKEGAYFEIGRGKCPRCEEEITEDQIKKIYNEATDNNLIKELTKALNKHRKSLGLDTCARKAHFFAQSREEAGSSLEPGVIGEIFNYYKDNLVLVPLKAFETTEGKKIASTYGRQQVAPTPAVSEANQIILANFAYGPQYTTGQNFRNTGNDGWNFRGRGLLQITGRSNYIAIQEKIDKLVPNSGVEVFKRFDSPNRAISRADGRMTAEEAVLTGLVEWIHKGMHTIADLTGKESDNTVVNKIIDKLNSGTKSREKREGHYKKTKIVFDVDNCLLLDKKVPISNVYGEGWNIDVHLYDDRKKMGYGILVLKNSNGKEQWRTIVRAQGYTNKIGKTRTETNSDTPTGIYKFEQWRSDGSKTIYGPNPRLDMTYESGEAKSAGREEIQIHGGRQKGENNPYLWNTGGCLRVFDDAIVTLKRKIDQLENKKSHFINIGNTLMYDSESKKYYIPEDYKELQKNQEGENIIKKGITNKSYYRNESNYYTNNLN